MKSKTIPNDYKKEKKDIFNKRFGIVFNGEDNLKPLIIENAIDLSPTASQCLDMYESFLGGGGFKIDLEHVNLSSDFWSRITPNDLLLNSCKDTARQSGVFININYNANFEKDSYKVIPYRLCRVGKKDSDGYSGKIVVSPKGWGLSLKKEDVHVYDSYNYNPDVIQQQVERDGGWENYKGQILFFKMDHQYTYPIPLIERAVNFCEVEFKMSLYYKGTVNRSFEDTTIVRHRPFDEEEDKKNFYKNLKDVSGIENGSSKMMVEDDWDDDRNKNGNIRFDTIKNEVKAEKYAHFESSSSNFIRKSVRGVPPQLVDFIPGKLGGTDDLKIAQSVFNANTARDRSRIERLFKELFRGYKENINPTDDWTIKQYKLLDDGTIDDK
ncbi:hypothetical protein [Tenacibaculum piscium]|uniref:hypothetical protein n=1 Tax=Tenacibaculum piscium TaxID=1458515 RepID=UPI001F3E36A6|nr:hypothetical protein [Tenacibaculum piscium]